MEPLLRIDQLRTEIGLRHGSVKAVDGLDLEVFPGETLGVVGESGSGKTILGLSIMRLLPSGGRIVDGRIVLDGQDLVGLSNKQMRDVRGRSVGFVFQDPMTSLNPTLPIGRQIAEAVRLHEQVTKSDAMTRALDLLQQVGMPHAAERVNDFPHQLSGGLRQRVMIAIALAASPKLLIADEPTTALDVTIQEQILELVDQLRRELDMAVILVTHDLGVIAGRADRVAVMYAGRVVEVGDTAQLFSNPRHPYTEALLAALPDNAAATHDTLYTIPGLPPDLTNPPIGCRFAPRCRYATKECVAAYPSVAGEASGHRFACFHPVGTPEGMAHPIGSLAWRRPSRPEAGHQDETARRSPRDEGRELLMVDHLVKDFDVTSGAVLQRKTGALSAVADVSFNLSAGQTFGLVGESGCGKSTTGRLIVGLERPTAGTITIAGHDTAQLHGRSGRELRRNMQLMFQDPYASLDPRMSIGAIVREPLAIQRVGSKREQERRVLELLDEVGLPATAVERYPHEFSGGQRQRVGLARALALNPKLVVADEPVSALDVSVQAQVLNLMIDLQKRHELSYVFISHDLGVVRHVSDTIGVMYLGKLVEVGPATECYERPLHPYTKGLLDAIPIADPAREAAKDKLRVTGELPSAIHPPSGCRFRTRCPIAQEVCAVEVPVLRAPAASEHLVACHFPLGHEPHAVAAVTASS
ncbi:ABC transporter ATP-binding protein [Leekyejoonella antrihumi]|uniref:ABC transporter ATP-binding protein n=1 Tax=Leekyejoonella antrihumi TaxID=1660198 RepID=A0A563E341_9MICO|nr:ABC transporter ATP-binding protein [Leekyejoonella antrihumi]TWP36622.1 ABC transporter ATP-binding protein [Leekyejoonella antrihumi]